MSMPRSSHELGQIQRWMQAVIMHPRGVEAGIESEASRSQIDVPPDRVEEVISRSRRLTSTERLRVYANAYYARLIECLHEEFPALVHALGETTFDGFALEYLQAYPSGSYTLATLGRNFPRFLAETRPADTAGQDGPGWPDFLIDLATVERTYSEVFDGPGVERERILQAEDLVGISPQDWPDARLIAVPCLRLLTLRYPVHEYISAVRHKADAVIPDPAPTYLVITRREYVVRRQAVFSAEYDMLSALLAGDSVGSAIDCAASRPGVNLGVLAENLQTWFRHWGAAGFFRAIQLGSATVCTVASPIFQGNSP